MKKLLLVSILVMIAAVGAFAQFEMSVGGGLLFDYSLGNGLDGTLAANESLNLEGGEIYKLDRNNMSVGGFVFFDAKYAELDISFAYGQIDHLMNMDNQETLWLGNVMQLGINIIGKYPFSLGKVYLFPMLGLAFNLVLSADLEMEIPFENRVDFVDDEEPAEWSQFGLLAGVGADFMLTESLFIRAEALLNIRLPSQKLIDVMNESVIFGSVGNTLGVGPRIKLGLGYRF